jgi:hypothetical protein
MAIHEGLHLVQGTAEWDATRGDQNLHQTPFDDAAREIYELGK